MITRPLYQHVLKAQNAATAVQRATGQLSAALTIGLSAERGGPIARTRPAAAVNAVCIVAAPADTAAESDVANPVLTLPKAPPASTFSNEPDCHHYPIDGTNPPRTEANASPSADTRWRIRGISGHESLEVDDPEE